MATLDDFLKFRAEIDCLTEDIRKTATLTIEKRAELEGRVGEVLQKMEALWLEEEPASVAPSLATEQPEIEPAAPVEVLAKKAGEVTKCKFCCEEMPCACFAHLPEPAIKIEHGGLFKIEFPEEYTTYDRANWLSAMKLVMAKRKVS
jgi:hypothetical protein